MKAKQDSAQSPSRFWVILAFFGGALGTAFQFLSIRLFCSSVGTDFPGVMAAQSSFFVAMAAGAWLQTRPVKTEDPAVRISLLFGLLGAWCLLSVVLVPIAAIVSSHLVSLSGSPFRWVGGIPWMALTFLPGAAAMGAMLPSFERILLSQPSRSMFPLAYSASVLGGACSLLGLAAGLIRYFGIREALMASGLTSISLGIMVARRKPTSPQDTIQPMTVTRPEVHDFWGNPAVVAILIGTVGIGFQTAFTRLVSELMDGTFFSYGAVSGCHLVISSTGAVVATRSRFCREKQGLKKLLLAWAATAAAAPLALIPLSAAVDVLRKSTSLPSQLNWLVEILLVVLSAGSSSFVMGMLFCRAAEYASASGYFLARWYAMNLLACGTSNWLILAGVNSIAGLRGAILMPTALAALWVAIKPGLRPQVATVLLLGALSLCLSENSWSFRRPPEGEALLESIEGLSATAAATEERDGKRVLRVNKRFQMGGTGARIAQQRQADIPLLLHPNPRSALFLGAGTGITANRASFFPNIHGEAVELLPEVLGLRRWFESTNTIGTLGSIPIFHSEDARRWVRSSTNQYDVVAGDLFHPALDGASTLYSIEHFKRVAARLNPGGIFCQWLPAFQMDEEALRVATKTFLQVFPAAEMWILHFNVEIPVFGLVSGRDGNLDPGVLTSRMGEPSLHDALRSTGFASPLHVYGCFAANTRTISEWSSSASLNTENRPVISLLADRRSNSGHGGALLVRLLKQWEQPATAQMHSQAESHLASFVRARNRYLEGLLAESTGALNDAMNAYIQAAGTSLYFTPAYARCVETIRLTHRLAPARAKEWYDRLESSQPNQPLGRRLLGPLFENSPGGDSPRSP